MKLTLLGTGCPSVDHKRFGPSNLITTNKAKILVDCGSGVTQRLNQLKLSGANIDALLLTHLHSDHVIDLGPLGGNNGGEIVFQGNLDKLLKSSTITAESLKKSFS